MIADKDITPELRAAEERAIEEYKKELKDRRSSAPSTVSVFRQAFRAGAKWASEPQRTTLKGQSLDEMLPIEKKGDA